MAQVVATQAAFDVRDRRTQRAADHAPKHRGHRVSVHEDERKAGTVAQRASQPAAFDEPRARDTRKPAGDV